MKKLLLTLLLPFVLLAEGGIQGVPPWPTQSGPELVKSGDLESLSDWTVGGCAASAPNAGVDGSGAIVITGNCRALSQTQISVPDPEAYPWIEVSMYVRKSSGANGEVNLTFRDLTHGEYYAPVMPAFSATLRGTGTATQGVVAAGGDFIEVYRLLAVNRRHSDENWRLDVASTGLTAGEIYVDRISVRPAWHPLYNFVKYPSFHGYIWSGEASALCKDEAIEQACGFADVVPPPGETLATVQVTVRLAAEPGCASPEKTVTLLPTERRSYWRIDASGLADDDSGYICAQLVRRTDGATLADFPDWKIVKRTPAWRAANLEHWVDDYGRWRDGEVPRFLWMTFQRFSSANCTGCVWDAKRGGKQSYLNIRGFNLPSRRSNWRPVEGEPAPTSIWYDFLRSGRNVSLYFSPFSGASPLGQSDQITPWLDALDSLGLKYIHITNQYQGSLLGGDATDDADESEAPLPPSISCLQGGGTISDRYVHAMVSAVGGSNGLISRTRLEESEVSAPATDTLPSNSAGSCVVTPPVCTGRQVGYWVYAKGTDSATPPLRQDFSLQSSRFVACGQSAELRTIIESHKGPLASSFGSEAGTRGKGERPWWQAKQDSDIDVLEQVTDLAKNRSALLGYYLCDECTAYDIGRNYRQVEYLREKDPGRLLMALPLEVRSLAGVDWFFSPVVDINAQDIYYEGQSLGDDLWAQGGSKGRTASCYSYAGGNVERTVSNANLNKVDLWVDDKMRSHDGSRFNLPVVMEFARTTQTCFGWTLDEMRKQLWKAVIGVQNWGVIGGVGTWGWVSGIGLERMAAVPADGVVDHKPGNESVGNTNALEADIAAGRELMAVEPMLLNPIADSTQLGFGKVLAGQPTSTLQLPTASCAGYTEPMRVVTKQLPGGQQWILATNLCQDRHQVTFSLANPREGLVVQDYFNQTDVALTGGTFTIETSDFDVHAFLVSTRTAPTENRSARERRERRPLQD